MKSFASRIRSFPPQVKYIIGNEMCERFSYYGMRGILVVYLAKYLAMPGNEATALFHVFAGAGYLFTLLGGWLSDRILGRYRTILYLSLFYCLGHASIALWPTRAGLYWGLALICLGMGGVKACVASFVGDQFSESNKGLVSAVFDIFYWSINFGAMFAAIAVPVILAKCGPAWAFGVPGILMGLATLIFWLGRGQYARVPPARETKAPGFMSILFYALSRWRRRAPGQGFFDTALEKYSAEDVDGAKAVLRIFKVFIFTSMLWGLLDQQGSTWVLQADQMNLNVLGFHLQAAQIRALNPILVMALIPVFSVYIYPAFERMGIKMTPLRRMGGGMAMAALSFVPVAMIQSVLDSGHKISVAWQFIPFALAAMAEIMVSITGLEFAYTQAPRSMKGTILSFWFLTTFFGDSLTAIVAEVNIFKGATYYYFFAGLMALVTVGFAWIASRYQVHDYFERVETA